MRIRPIHFVADVQESLRFYEALGLRCDVRSRSGDWIELTAAGGELAIHDGAVADDGRGREGLVVTFVADEPLEDVERRLRTAGFPPEGTIVDQSWGRSVVVKGPDGTLVQIDEQDSELYT